MKIVSLILFTISTFTNVCYASFPITDTLQISNDSLQSETIEIYHLRMQKMGFDIENCRCDDCKKFKGINPLKKDDVRQNQKANIWPLLKTFGIWFLAIVVLFAIWLVVGFWNALKGLGDNPIG
tara:strand:- start:364 stop:735 length:372 start_codon:yes stop_codon:yes gene_type:complete